MENINRCSPVDYNVFCGEGSETETAILRNHRFIDGLVNTNSKDLVTTCSLFNNVIERGKGESRCIGYRKKFDDGTYDNKYTWISYLDFKTQCVQFAKGLKVHNMCTKVDEEDAKYGIQKKIVLYANNSVEWLIGFYGSHYDNITVATIFNGLGLSLVSNILDQVCTDTIIIDKVSVRVFAELATANRVQTIKNVIICGSKKDFIADDMKLLESKFNVFTVQDILRTGADSDVETHEATPESICVLGYTSGTINNPKGAITTHRNLLCNTEVTYCHNFTLSDKDCFYDLLPLSHSMGLFIVNAIFYFGGSVALFSERQHKLIEDMQMVNPTLFCAVPKVLEVIYNTILKKIDAKNVLIRKFVRRTINKKIKQLKDTGKVTFSTLENIALKQIRNLFGNNLRLVLIGGATLNENVFDFVKALIGCNIIHGYGLTETCAASFLSNADDFAFDHVGSVSGVSEFKLVNVDELNYHVTDVDQISGISAPSGEIYCRGHNVCLGYYKNPQETSEVYTEDGWFKTGDIGVLKTDHGNALKIIDRKKNIFKLSNGEYVSPEKLETLITSKCPKVFQICVVPSAKSNYVGAIVVPDLVECKWEGLDEQQLNTPELSDPLLQEITTIESNEHVAFHEVLKKIYITNVPFTVENNLLTPSLKKKRFNIAKKYAEHIKNFFN